MKAVAAKRRIGIRRRAQFYLLSAHLMRGLYLLWIRVDKKTRKYSRLPQTAHGGTHDSDVGFYVKAAFGGDLVWSFRNQRYSIGPGCESNLQHLFGGGHL